MVNLESVTNTLTNFQCWFDHLAKINKLVSPGKSKSTTFNQDVTLPEGAIADDHDHNIAGHAGSAAHGDDDGDNVDDVYLQLSEHKTSSR